jgi:hypothetical protein
MTLENPYRNGAYHFTIAALIQMGLNKAHKFSAFAAKFQKVWNKADAEGWKGFEKRKARNEATAKDLDGRILQNCRVLQRIKDYGRPLLKAGAVLDLTRDTGGVLQVCLNTKSKKPQKPGRAIKAAKKMPHASSARGLVRGQPPSMMPRIFWSAMAGSGPAAAHASQQGTTALCTWGPIAAAARAAGSQNSIGLRPSVSTSQ